MPWVLTELLYNKVAYLLAYLWQCLQRQRFQVCRIVYCIQIGIVHFDSLYKRRKGTKKNGYVQEKLVFIIRDNVFGIPSRIIFLSKQQCNCFL